MKAHCEGYEPIVEVYTKERMEELFRANVGFLEDMPDYTNIRNVRITCPKCNRGTIYTMDITSNVYEKAMNMMWEDDLRTDKVVSYVVLSPEGCVTHDEVITQIKDVFNLNDKQAEDLLEVQFLGCHLLNKINGKYSVASLDRHNPLQKE